MDSVPGIYTIARPHCDAVPLILDSPHSGMNVPSDFKPIVPADLWRCMCDPLVDQLFADAPSHGAAFLTADFPRVYIDANRADDDIDPSLFVGWDGPSRPTEKSSLGKGLFWLNVKPDRQPLYAAPLTGVQMRHRIERYHRPYHDALDKLMDDAHVSHGVAFHINCHSMRGVSGTMDAEGPGLHRTDIVLSDRDGASTMPDFMAKAAEVLRQAGLEVAINDPFKGAEIIRRTGQPEAGRHAIQIEINRRLYLEPDGLTASSGFEPLKRTLSGWVAALSVFAQSQAAR